MEQTQKCNHGTIFHFFCFYKTKSAQTTVTQKPSVQHGQKFNNQMSEHIRLQIVVQTLF